MFSPPVKPHRNSFSLAKVASISWLKMGYCLWLWRGQIPKMEGMYFYDFWVERGQEMLMK